jgi:hypothetical protein
VKARGALAALQLVLKYSDVTYSERVYFGRELDAWESDTGYCRQFEISSTSEDVGIKSRPLQSPRLFPDWPKCASSSCLSVSYASDNAML